MGLGDPDKLALGAAKGEPAAFIILLAALLSGKRIATLLSPALTTLGIISDLGKIIVSGPGQNFSAHKSADFGISFAIS